MKIGRKVGGYHSIGTGHTYRQLSLMEEQLDFEYFFYISNSQNLACQLLEENFINYRIFNNIEELFNLIKNDKIDIIINDFLDTNEDYIKNLKLNNLFVVNFEDRGSGIKYADIVINDMYENKLTENCMNIFNGFKYTCMRRDLKLYKPLKFKNICKNIVITFGGSDPQNFTKLVLDILISNKIYENMKIIVILGLGYKYDNNIYEYRKYNIIVLKNVLNMPIILQKADIGITANGRTLFEFAHFGIPCISLAQNDREKIHTFAKEDNGVIFLGERKDFIDNDLLISINKLINNHNYRKKLSENMKQANKILQNSNDNIWKLILDKYNFQNIDIILQCRLNSSRLPNKAIKTIVNKKMIEHQIERLKRCKNINNIILCTSTNIENNILINIANEMDIKYFRGSEDNVLERFYQCAKKYKSKNIIRCTGDCPLIDPLLIDLLCENFVKKKINHLNFRNKDITRNNNFPDGFDAEIFTFEVLEEAYKNDNSDFGKEHVTPYIVKKYGKNYCQIPNVEKYNLDNFHYSVDTEEDFKKIEEIYNELYPKNDKFNLYDILNYLNNKKYEIVDKCPLCNNKNSNKFSIKNDNIILLECTKCNLIYNNKIMKNDVFYKQFINYRNNQKLEYEDIKLLSNNKNREKQYLLDYNFIKKHISIENKKILDFGCGAGEFLDFFVSNNKYGIEIDINKNEILKKKNIIKINSIDQYFDIIIFRGTFQYIRNLNEVISSIKKYLNYDGYLIFLQIPNRNSPLFNLLKDNWMLTIKEEFLHYWSVDSLKKIFPEFYEIVNEYPYKETPYYDKNDINKLIKSYINNTKETFAFYDNMFSLILKNSNMDNMDSRHSNSNNNKLNYKFCNFCKKENPMELYYPNVRNCQEGYIVKCKECDLRQLFNKKNVSLKEFYLNDGQDKAIQSITKISKLEQIESEAQTMIQRAKIIQEKINDLKLVKKDIKIIDVGGGYGNLSLEIRKLNINNDINLQIDILEPRKLENLFYTKYNLNKITTFLDYDFVEKNKKKYDFVLNYHVLEHVSNPVDFLKNMYDLINENGYLCLEVPNDDLDLIQINKKYADKINYIESHENYFTKITLSKICMKIGINPEIKGFQIYGYENYNNWVKNIPNKIGKEIDFFTNNYKKDSKEYKWYNDRIINFTCDTIYFIHKKKTYNQQQYLKILPNEYELENIIFDNTNFENNSIEIVKEMINLYNKMNNNASGDWKWISNNKINIDELFKSNNYNEIDKLYSNFSRNFISFGIISNGIYENLIKNDKMMFTLKQNILNDIDTCIELCNITNINVLDSSRIGNFYGINKNNVFITPDNIRHYYSAYKINNFIYNVKNPIIMEIGAGYGGLLVNLLKSRKDNFCYINVDIRNTLLVFYYYIKSYIELKKLDKKIYFSENGNVTEQIIKEFDIILIPNDKHQNINVKIDIVFNSHSLSEMSIEHMEDYFRTIHRLNIKHIFHINSIYFPWKNSDRNHIQISTKDFPIDKKKYIKIYHCISPWITGSGRYREYYYKFK